MAADALGDGLGDGLGRVTLVTGKEEFLNERTVRGVRAAVRAHDPEAELSETAAGACDENCLVLEREELISRDAGSCLCRFGDLVGQGDVANYLLIVDVVCGGGRHGCCGE